MQISQTSFENRCARAFRIGRIVLKRSLRNELDAAGLGSGADRGGAFAGNRAQPIAFPVETSSGEQKMFKTIIAITGAVSFSCGALVVTPVVARDQQCGVLESLATKYAGVKLTPEQEVMKVKLTSWYLANCHGHQVAKAGPTAAFTALR